MSDIKEFMESERAKRTHLRDDTRKAKATALNLSVELLDCLSLALAALDRPLPKQRVAIHKIELAIDSIQANIDQFKN